MRTFTLASAVIVSLFLVGCSSKEIESNEHALTEELEMIEKAQEAVDRSSYTYSIMLKCSQGETRYLLFLIG